MKIRLVNYRKELGREGAKFFHQWFRFDRHWHNRLWAIGIKHYCLILDFRRDWVKDMEGEGNER